MLELTLNAEMAVKLIKLKKQAQTELGKMFSIADEEGVAHLILSAATFHHRHSKARIFALELLDGVEALDNKSRHVDFIANCRGQLALQQEEASQKIYRGQVIDDTELKSVNTDSVARVYRGQSVLLEEAPENFSSDKVVYYRGQKKLSDSRY